SGGVFEVSAIGGLVPLTNLQTASALVVSPKSDTLYALDTASSAVVRVTLQGGPTDRWELPLTNPVALQFGTDVRHPVLYVSGGADQALIALDPQTGAVDQRTDLSFNPSLLDPLPGGGFLLTSRVGQDSVLWSFAPGRGTYFIPAPPPAEDVPARGR